ncbi:MAG: ATP-binding protein [Streptosporangiaceae bacterium]|jgi:ATP-dependent DNA helicase RecG
MTPDELRERILSWENPHTDFKREVSHNDELAKDLVCFANGDGGQIIIGVDDRRNVVGVTDTDALMLRADDVAFNRCSPALIVTPEVVMLDDKAVVVLNVPKGDQRPYATSDGRYYVRSGVRCRHASRDQMLRMFQASDSLFYDEQPLPRLHISDLDLDAVSRHLADAQELDLGAPGTRL